MWNAQNASPKRSLDAGYGVNSNAKPRLNQQAFRFSMLLESAKKAGQYLAGRLGPDLELHRSFVVSLQCMTCASGGVFCGRSHVAGSVARIKIYSEYEAAGSLPPASSTRSAPPGDDREYFLLSRQNFPESL